MTGNTDALFSIGAVARMLDLSAATIRTWETRYRLVVPQRSSGGQRLYSRDQVEQLRYVARSVREGRRPAEAHRLLAERIARGEVVTAPTRLLFAESRRGAVAALLRLFGSAAFEIHLAADPHAARAAFDELEPAVVVIDTSDPAFAELADGLRRAGTKVLPIELLERPLALLDEARALLETS